MASFTTLRARSASAHSSRSSALFSVHRRSKAGWAPARHRPVRVDISGSRACTGISTCTSSAVASARITQKRTTGPPSVRRSLHYSSALSQSLGDEDSDPIGDAAFASIQNDPTEEDRGTFVSSFYQMDQGDIVSYLQRKGLYFIDSGPDKLVVKVCPFCPDTKGQADNMRKLFIWKSTGSFYCHRCDCKGSWFDFKRRLGDAAPEPSVAGGAGKSARAPAAAAKRTAPAPMPDPAVVEQYHRSMFPTDGSPLGENARRVLKYLSGRDKDERGISKAILRKYHVGMATAMFQGDDSMWREHVCVSFPWTKLVKPASGSASASASGGEAGKVVVDRVKLRSVQTKSHQRLLPAGGAWGFFGWHTVPEDADQVVITEGEYDAMAVHQMTGLPAISLPNGCRNLPVELLPRLERFRHIILWMDSDAPGQEGAQKFARKLGVSRCVIVQPSAFSPTLLAAAFADDRSYVNRTLGEHEPGSVLRQRLRQLKPKDANEALQVLTDVATAAAQGKSASPTGHICQETLQQCLAEVMQWITQAAPVAHQQISSFAELRSTVRRELTDPSTIRGLQSRSLPGLSALLKGHRRGELTILTGPTGVGKTTLLSQLSLDYCRQGVSTMWGSFEIKNERLAKRMLQQYAGLNSVNLERSLGVSSSLEAAAGGTPEDAKSINMDMFDLWADRFQTLPLHFMRFHGSTGMDEVLDAMDYGVYVHDVEHILLDNLQFMLAGQQAHVNARGFGTNFDKFELQDRAIQALRQFASNKNVHITLVVHPRKENDPNNLNLSSIFGGAKVTQEADNVIILGHNTTSSTSANGARQTGNDRSSASHSGQTATSPTPTHGLKRISVVKNRFDGTTGDVLYRFDSDTCLAVEVKPEELVAADNVRSKSGGSGGPSASSSQNAQPAPVANVASRVDDGGEYYGGLAHARFGMGASQAAGFDVSMSNVAMAGAAGMARRAGMTYTQPLQASTHGLASATSMPLIREDLVARPTVAGPLSAHSMTPYEVHPGVPGVSAGAYDQRRWQPHRMYELDDEEDLGPPLQLAWDMFRH